MTLLLNAAIEPGFAALRSAEGWTWKPLSIGRGAAFPGVAVEELAGDAEGLRRIVVVHGPGSSTGLRIVCSYANALALTSGAAIAVLSCFELVHLLSPERPSVLAFPQPLGRIVVASRMPDGTWETAEPASVPEGAWMMDGPRLATLLPEAAPDVFDAVDAAAEEQSLAVPRYWAAPLITKKKEQS